MYNTPCCNIEWTSTIPSCRSKVLIDSRFDIRDVTREHTAQNTICGNFEERLRIKRGIKQISLLEGLVVLVFDGKFVDDEFVDTRGRYTEPHVARESPRSPYGAVLV